MRLHRFYIQHTIEPSQPVIVTDEALVHQWKKVFRLATGNKVIIFDGNGCDYVAELTFEGKNSASLQIVETRGTLPVPKTKVTLYSAIVKKDNFEWIAEKATELGVARIVPIISERSEKKNVNVERLARILIESSEQSGRGGVPEIEEIISLEDAITQLKSQPEFSENSIAWDPTGQLYSESEIKKDTLNIFIGPEGGWTEKELEMFTRAGIAVRSIGSQVLRAETAVVAILAKVIL